MLYRICTIFTTLFLLCFDSLGVSDSIDRVIEDLLAEKLGAKNVIFELEYDSKDTLLLAQTHQDQIKDVVLLSEDKLHSTFRTKVLYEDGSSNELFGRYQAFIEMPVASRFLKAGEIIGQSDINTVKTKINRVKDNYVTNESEVVGMQAKKNISAGVLIRNNELSRPPVIRINDPVNIIYSANGIMLKTSGIAMGTGAINDMIKVKNEDTGTLLLGQIVNKNTVQVGSNNE